MFMFISTFWQNRKKTSRFLGLSSKGHLIEDLSSHKCVHKLLQFLVKDKYIKYHKINWETHFWEIGPFTFWKAIFQLTSIKTNILCHSLFCYQYANWRCIRFSLSLDEQVVRKCRKYITFSKSAHPTVVASVAQWRSTSHAIGESWAGFPLEAPDFFQTIVLLLFSLRHIRVPLSDDEQVVRNV